ncbi:MAG: transposase [Synechococcaceae cyanobacterium SM2_3_1]|nr:transposase [Synechococcaceae cyanobacterium SM2_3_1]
MKEELCSIFERVITVEEGKSQIVGWLNKGQRIYCDAIKTTRNHLEGICQYFANRSRQRRLGAVTSGIMEGINNRIKVIKLQGYGFTNIANLMLRLAYTNRARLLVVFWP